MDAGAAGGRPSHNFVKSTPSQDGPAGNINLPPKPRKIRETRKDATNRWMYSDVVEESEEVARAVEWAKTQPDLVATPNILRDPELLVYMYRLWLAENYGFDYPPQVKPALTRMQQKILNEWIRQQEAKLTQAEPADGAVAAGFAQVTYGEGKNRGEEEDHGFNIDDEFEYGRPDE